MMNIPPGEAKKLSLHEYEALLWHWNDAHKMGDDVGTPDPELTMKLIAQINADERLTGPAPVPEAVN